jgi:hypothetical protein
MVVVWRIPSIRDYSKVVLRMIRKVIASVRLGIQPLRIRVDGSMLYGKIFGRCRIIVIFAIISQDNMPLGASGSLQ